MSTFDRFKKTTEDLFNGEKDRDYSTENGLGNDNQFEFDVPEEGNEKVVVDDSAEDAVESPYEISKVNLTVIGDDTIVTGDIKTKGHIEVLGTVKGNISAEGNVALRSDMKGNVRGNNIGLGACSVNGDIEAVKNILTDPESDINGNIKGTEISVAGEVNGDVRASKMVVLKKDAVMEGDIDTDGLVVEPGAIMNGRVSISRKPRKPEPPKRSQRIPDPFDYQSMANPVNHQRETPSRRRPEPQREEPMSRRDTSPVEADERVIDIDDTDITDI